MADLDFGIDNMLLGDQNPGIVTGQVTGGVSSNNNDVIVYRVYLNFSW